MALWCCSPPPRCLPASPSCSRLTATWQRCQVGGPLRMRVRVRLHKHARACKARAWHARLVRRRLLLRAAGGLGGCRQARVPPERGTQAASAGTAHSGAWCGAQPWFQRTPALSASCYGPAGRERGRPHAQQPPSPCLPLRSGLPSPACRGAVARHRPAKPLSLPQPAGPHLPVPPRGAAPPGAAVPHRLLVQPPPGRAVGPDHPTSAGQHGVGWRGRRRRCDCSPRTHRTRASTALACALRCAPRCTGPQACHRPP